MVEQTLLSPVMLMEEFLLAEMYIQNNEWSKVGWESKI
jgi:hypothetical protein